MPTNRFDYRFYTTPTFQEYSNHTIYDSFAYNSEQMAELYRWILTQSAFSKKDRVTKLGNKID